ncbi:MAG: protein-glutamate O-methyltransferase CheR [Defluviitaleaceae bacterium]|nr:protein-glutamate O-methyltransferase CheR [Defluviitaleaceae bacterium]
MLILHDNEFKLFKEFIKKRFGINLSDEKKSLVYSRLRSVVESRELSSFKDYYDIIEKDGNGELTKEFVDKITTNHTFFMREKEHFEYLKNKVFPYIKEKHSNTKDIRLWCAACSSGEEAYTLQMLLQDYFGDKNWNLEILATDISNTVLNTAYRGIYTKDDLSVLPIEWQSKYFNEYDEYHLEAKDVLKKNITFTRFNFIEDKFSFRKKFQVIFCRNAMIYFDSQTRNTLVNKFYDNMEDGGYFFIGQSESLSGGDTKFKYVIPAVYKK